MRLINLLGKRFGKLSVLNRNLSRKDNNKTFWDCICDCGNLVCVPSNSLINGDTTSCGCNRIRKIVSIGDVFGNLVVLSQQDKNTWSCKCSCGKELNLKGFILLNGRKQCSRTCKNSNNKLAEGQASINSAYRDFTKSARRRKIKVEITKEEFIYISTKPCIYCGQHPESVTNKNGKLNGDFLHNGIDRVNNSIGYVKNNVVPCCWNCNRAKGTLTMEEFKNWIQKIKNHWIR